MSQYPFLPYLYLRESGQVSEPFDQYPQAPNAKRSVSFNINAFNNGVIKSNSRVIWIQGWENLVFTLNSHGQVVVYNLLDSSKTLMLTTDSEKSFRIFFALDSLFMAVNNNFNSRVQFFLIPLHSLQNAAPQRLEILKSLNTEKSSIKEIDSSKFRIIVEKSATIEIWDCQKEQLIATLPKNPSIHYQVTEDFFVFWETGATDTKLGLFKFDHSFGTKFSVNCTEEIYLCKVIKNQLVLGFRRCELKVINLDGFACRTVGNGVLKSAFEIENSEEIFLVFNDLTCFIGLDEKCDFQMFSASEYYCCKFGDGFVVAGSNGKLAVLRNGVEYVETRVRDVQQVGTNFDASQILLACKGKIWIVE